jgi:hypothetical protein
MEPGSTTGVLIRENLRAAPFASAVRHSGGQLIADGRIPIRGNHRLDRGRPSDRDRRRLNAPLSVLAPRGYRRITARVRPRLPPQAQVADSAVCRLAVAK